MENRVVKALQNHLTLLNTMIDNCANIAVSVAEVLGRELMADNYHRHSWDYTEVSKCLMAEIGNAGQVRVNNGKLYLKCVDDFGNQYWGNIFLYRPMES